MLPIRASARKFDFKLEGMATYIRGTYGPSLVGSDPYANSSGVGTSVDQSISSNFSGEFGLLFKTGPANLRLGGELLIPATLGTIVGSSSAGVKWFSLDSKLRSIAGLGTLEIPLKSGATSKFLFYLGGGVAWVTLDNVYAFTTAGTSQFNLADFTESAKGISSVYHAGLMYEVLFTDTATLAIEAGYRYQRVDSLTYSKDQTTFAGAKTEGQTLVNQSGSTRTFDMSGPYGGLSLRFYVGGK